MLETKLRATSIERRIDLGYTHSIKSTYCYCFVDCVYETLLWQRMYNQFDEWRFGSVTLTGLEAPRLDLVIKAEGSDTPFSKGDIAVDDVTVTVGNCEYESK